MAKNETNESSGYAKELKLSDGRRVSLRLMDAADKQRVLRFAQSLPPDDLLFLRTDITEPALIDEWIGNLEKGATVTVLAEIDGDMAGYASLHLEQARWTRRVGEIRVQVGVPYRGVGLGRQLTAANLSTRTSAWTQEDGRDDDARSGGRPRRVRKDRLQCRGAVAGLGSRSQRPAARPFNHEPRPRGA